MAAHLGNRISTSLIPCPPASGNHYLIMQEDDQAYIHGEITDAFGERLFAFVVAKEELAMAFLTMIGVIHERTERGDVVLRIDRG